MRPFPEDGWERRTVLPAPLPAPELVEILDGLGRPCAWERLSGGLANDNLAVTLDDGRTVVVRRYLREPAAAAREARLLDRMAGVVPVPRVLKEAEGLLVLSLCPGRRLAEVLPGATPTGAEALGAAVGEVMAAVHGEVLGPAGHLAVHDGCLRVLPWEEGTWRDYLGTHLDGVAGTRLGPDRRARLRALEPPAPAAAVLLHADFKPSNLLVADGRVTAVLDWEFAFSGDAAFDLGQLLRWEDHLPVAFTVGLWRTCGLPGTAWSRALRWDLLNLVGFLDGPEAPRRHADVLDRVDRTLSRLSPLR